MTVRLRFLPKRPYSLPLTAQRYMRFPEVVDLFDGETYRRLLPVGRKAALLEVRQEGSPSRAVLHARLTGPAAASPAAHEAARRIVEVALGASTEVRGFYLARRADPLLSAAIRDFQGLRGAGVPSLWEALVTAILAQQVNLQFAYDIRRQLAETFGPKARIGGETFTGFPAPEAFGAETPATLRRFRLSNAKAAAIHGLAQAFAQGDLSEVEIAGLPDEQAIERLTALRGVGRWTAEIGLLRGLGRTDIFPAGDLGVVKYLAQGLLGRPAKAKEGEMRIFAERWKPHRGLALVYGYAEINRRKARPAPPPARPARPPGRGSARPRRG